MRRELTRGLEQARALALARFGGGDRFAGHRCEVAVPGTGIDSNDAGKHANCGALAVVHGTCGRSMTNALGGSTAHARIYVAEQGFLLHCKRKVALEG